MNRIKITLPLLTLNSVAIFAQDLEDGLLLHYEFNGDTEDASINDFTGVPNGITYGLDRYGNPASAAYFDGIDDFIDLPYLEVLKPDLPITISFWVKFDNLSYENASVFNTSYENDVSSGVYFTTTADDSRIAVGYGDGSFGYSPSNRRTYLSNSSITADEWHNITVILISATEMKVYLDCRDMGGSIADHVMLSPTQIRREV
ncbi:MAG: LamG-like jellyroll fold domain-containing protein [Crocinitomicaceae bacterium]